MATLPNTTDIKAPEEPLSSSPDPADAWESLMSEVKARSFAPSKVDEEGETDLPWKLPAAETTPEPSEPTGQNYPAQRENPEIAIEAISESSDEEENTELQIEQQMKAEIPSSRRTRRGRRTAAEMLALATKDFLGDNFVDIYGHGEEYKTPQKKQKHKPAKSPAPIKSDVVGPPRKRGRPPKANKIPVATTVSAPDIAAQTPKRRGRPPKVPRPATVASLQEVISANVAAAPSGGVYDVPITPVKRRGRPPKSATAASVAQCSVTPSPSPAKQRGRPPKFRRSIK